MVPVVLGQLVALILGACDVWFARIGNIIVNLILNLLDQYISWSMVIWFRLFRAFNSMQFLADFLHTATQVLSILFLLHCSSTYLLIFLFSFFVCVYSKFWVNLCQPINSLPFALLQFFSHLISSSSFNPLPLPTSRLPSPSPFAWLKQTSDLPLCLHQWTMDAWLWSFVFLCIFSIMTYVQWFEVISISRIGLLDKLERVSCPILLALCWSTPRIYDMWFCCCYMLSSCSLCQ